MIITAINTVICDPYCKVLPLFWGNHQPVLDYSPQGWVDPNTAFHWRVYLLQQCWKHWKWIKKKKPFKNNLVHSHTALLIRIVPIGEAEAGHCVVLGALHRTQVCVPSCSAVPAPREKRTAAAQLFVELLLKALAEQVEGERVDTWITEGQDARTHAGDEVAHGRVYFGVVVGAVQVDHMTGQPADSEEAHKHQHGLSQALPRLDLRHTEKRC